MATILAHGTVLSMSTDGGSTYAEITEVVDVSGPSLTRAAIDVTPLNNTGTLLSLMTRKYKPGLTEPGDMTFTVRPASDNAKWVALVASLGQTTDTGSTATEAIKYFKVASADAGTTSDAIFTGFLSGISPAYKLDDVYVVDATVKMTGGTFTMTQ